MLGRFPYLERELGRIATHTVGRLHLEGPDGDSTLIDAGEAAALLIRRVEFDALLVSLAVEAGAELVTGADIVQATMDDERVSLTARDGRQFDAPFVIAADGVYSVIARRFGLNHRWPARSLALDMMEETPRASLREADPSMLWVAYGFDRVRNRGRNRGDRRAPEGYAYIFPKRDHVNVGVGYVLDHYRRSIDAAPYDVQRGFIDHLAGRGIIAGESVRANFTPFQIPVGGPLRRPGAGRVLLAGDAGGFVNAFTAEGIYYAMVSGELAARAVAELPSGGGRHLPRRYRRACDDEIGAELRDSVLIQRYLFADRRRIAKFIDGAARAPVMTRSILDFAIGRLGYAQLRRRLLAGAPRLAGRVVWEQMKEFGASLRGFGPGAESAGP